MELAAGGSITAAAMIALGPKVVKGAIRAGSKLTKLGRTGATTAALAARPAAGALPGASTAARALPAAAGAVEQSASQVLVPVAEESAMAVSQASRALAPVPEALPARGTTALAKRGGTAVAEYDGIGEPIIDAEYTVLPPDASPGPPYAHKKQNPDVGDRQSGVLDTDMQLLQSRKGLDYSLKVLKEHERKVDALHEEFVNSRISREEYEKRHAQLAQDWKDQFGNDRSRN